MAVGREAAPRPKRLVDAHVHLWDPARADWYPYLARPAQVTGGHEGSGDGARMARRFDLETYQAEAEGWNVEKVVNVAAATGGHSVDETLALDEAAELRGAGVGGRARAGSVNLAAIVGGLPPTDSVAGAVALLDRQMAATRFRGVRPMGPLDRPVPDAEVLRALAERGLVFELMTHPDQLEAAAGALERAVAEGLAVVVEHTGWPRSGAVEEQALWQAGIHALAGLGHGVVCKLSGLAMPLRSMRPDAFAPWLEGAIDAFGFDRCMFASNFPVDSMYGTFSELYDAFSTVTRGVDEESRDKLFAGNAERVYRC